MNNPTYLYTETAFHHEGSYDYLKQLIDETKRIGANGIKFQVLTNTNDFITSKHKDYKLLSDFCLSYDEWKDIFTYTQESGLDIILMPLNIEAMELSHFARYIDIHSVSFNDSDLLDKINTKDCEIIIGVGGRTEEEIDHLIRFFGEKVKILMAGFQSFPSDLKDVNLGKISYYKQKYPTLDIGYADHSSYKDPFAVLSNDYARLLGATVFEKHITIHEGEEKTDYASAVSGDKIKQIIDNLNFINNYVLNGKYDQMSQPEKNYRNRQLIGVAATDLPAGTVLEKKDISLKLHHEFENHYTTIESLVGKKLLVNLDKDAPFNTKSLQE
ncbi:N,N'-diacetyllegionaminate synthase [Chryseobacterium defluvii]|uniref:N,N'-diacetyllegionaminate synthase n=1 Tax=Chryseobacterium defluvii TaxID=160396 RepID=A0A840KF42_9FLAO|nr:N-acetylneuraminate synthase family protein [Chryseobacterium defluvii]MBB4806597.1 N,N'-diacetyllegionaminate synthase [Chryseobacterium defluvii]